MTAVSKKVYFDFLNDIVDKYNNTYHRTIKIKPIDVKSDSYTKYNVDSNEEDLQFKIGVHVRTSMYKNLFAKGYAPNWLPEVFVVSKIRNIVLRTYVISDLNGDKIFATFYENKLQKSNQK